MAPEPKKIRINVHVRFFTTLREITGKKEEQIQLPGSATLKALLRQLSKKYGREFQDYTYDELGNVHGHLQFLINGKNTLTAWGLKTKLKDGDQIAILPPVGGG